MGWFGRGRQEGERKDLVNFDSLRRIAHDLTNLEVNTIVKKDLTARKMPPPPLAMVEVAKGYLTWLEDKKAPSLTLCRDDLHEIGGKLRQAVDDGGAASYAPDLISQGKHVFEMLRDAAKALTDDEAAMKKLRADGHDAIAVRILDSSHVLLGLVERYGKDQSAEGAPKGELVSGDMVALRKIWEVGVQSVKMQTIIQLDGDVITYVQESVAKNADDPVHKIHSENVKIAMDSWRFLVSTVGKMAGRLINIVIPSGPS